MLVVGSTPTYHSNIGITMSKRQYKLPTNPTSYTTNSLEYVKAWDILAKKIEPHIPDDYYVAAVDPGFEIKSKPGSGKDKVFTVPLDVALHWASLKILRKIK